MRYTASRHVRQVEFEDGSVVLWNLAVRRGNNTLLLPRGAAAVLWNSLKGGASVEEAIETLQTRYSVDRSRLETDLQPIIQSLLKNKMLVDPSRVQRWWRLA